MKLAFYKNSKTNFGKLVRFQQKYIKIIPWRYAQMSHVELCIPYKEVPKGTECLGVKNEKFRIGDGSSFDDLAKVHGISWSSSELDNGTRFKVITWNTNNWEFVELGTTKEENRKIVSFCLTENNQKYAYWAILFAQGFQINFVRHGYWFCSHACLTAVMKGISKESVYDFVKRFTHFSNPAQLYEWSERYFKFNKN